MGMKERVTVQCHVVQLVIDTVPVNAFLMGGTMHLILEFLADGFTSVIIRFLKLAVSYIFFTQTVLQTFHIGT